MPAGNPFLSELIGVQATPVTVTGATAPTKTAMATFAIPGYRLQSGAVVEWKGFGQVTLGSANHYLTPSIELGSLQTYNTTHSRSGANHGIVYSDAGHLTGYQFLPTGLTATATDWWGTGMVVVTAAPGASITCRGGGHMHFPGLDQGGGTSPSMGFDTDGANSSAINTTSSLNFGLYVTWTSGADSGDIFTVNGFTASILGYTSPL